MRALLASALLAITATLPAVQTAKTANSSRTHPAFMDAPPGPTGLTLYNERGEMVAQCERKNDLFQDCKMAPGVTLDDLMNAWFHAYLEVQK